MGDRESTCTLGHKDRKRAIAEAHELIAHLRSNDGALTQDEVTLNVLMARYLASEAQAANASSTRRADERKLRRVVAFKGGTRKATSLGSEDVRRFTRARLSGAPELQRVTPGVEVGNRTVEADLVALRTMLNWARGDKNKEGKPLLTANPLFGVSFPKELNPRLPLVTEDEYMLLLQAAREASPLLEAALVVAEGSGRRLSAWRRLRWSDVRFDQEQFGTIHWVGEFDKTKRELLRPINPGGA